MKVLILGGTGMLGHKAWQVLKNDLDVFLTIQGDFSQVLEFGIFEEKRTISNVDVLKFAELEEIIRKYKPNVILNCVGIVKQLMEAKDTEKSEEINSLFPHRLSKLCVTLETRLIHISTDCVFSGNKGNYTENDRPDPVDLYGRTKLSGEVVNDNALTLRTSIIGHELKTHHSLVEWFLSQQGKTVNGYVKALYSGFPTIVFCNILKDIITKYSNLKGLFHISSAPIDKYSLLCLIKNTYNLNIQIEKYDQFNCDRSLDSSAFKKATGFKPQSWNEMIESMHKDYKINRRLS